SNAKIEGQNYMLKFSAESFDIIEPYIMIGTSDLKVKWEQNGNTVTVEAEPGFTWGMGVKTKLMEFKDYGVKLTMDIQFRNADLNIDKPLLNGAGASARDEKCEIKEWQIALLASKKYIVPMGLRDYYIVPYTGVTFSWADVDVSFKDGNSSGPPYPLYSTYNATEDSHIGLVFGCDVMPSLLSWYLFNFELRLINETAFSLGGTMKF
ncbi:MAG: hypothetical protein KJ952_02535, partial [Candidatus Omnitrophica bacterium]|nr:hypothetical protein [Candidatus Omnitrophota bacterium]